jgi:hypothetical protein
MRAERKSGELLEEAKKSGARHTGRGNNNRKLESPRDTPNLSELGISRVQSSQWQQLAAIPKRQFEEILESAEIVPSTKGILRTANAAKKQG